MSLEAAVVAARARIAVLNDMSESPVCYHSIVDEGALNSSCEPGMSVLLQFCDSSVLELKMIYK